MTASRTSRRLLAVATGLEVETRIRCQDDDHPAGVWNPLLEQTFCHCGRVQYVVPVEPDRWPDRDARLTAHVGVAS